MTYEMMESAEQLPHLIQIESLVSEMLRDVFCVDRPAHQREVLRSVCFFFTFGVGRLRVVVVDARTGHT